MRPTFTRFIAAMATLVVGVLIGFSHQHAQQRPVLSPDNAGVATALPALAPPVVLEDVNFPADLEPTPFNIENFIRENPSGKLKTLWERLKIKTDPNSEYNLEDSCNTCEVHTLEFDLDNDGMLESVVQIKDFFGTANRYLIFVHTRDGQTKLLGHVDAGGRYPPADPMVLISNGQAYLIVQSMEAGGSGLGVWRDTVYQVSNGRVKPVASYLAKETQSGELGLPTKEFGARPLSFEIEHGRAILTLSYQVEYSAAFREAPLFTKEQKVVLRGSLKDGSTVLDPGRSEVTPREFETIYNYDSMSADDFLNYNQAELRAIATGNNSKNKAWLSEFLDACKDSSLTRELYRLLSAPRKGRH